MRLNFYKGLCDVARRGTNMFWSIITASGTKCYCLQLQVNVYNVIKICPLVFLCPLLGSTRRRGRTCAATAARTFATSWPPRSMSASHTKRTSLLFTMTYPRTRGIRTLVTVRRDSRRGNEWEWWSHGIVYRTKETFMRELKHNKL